MALHLVPKVLVKQRLSNAVFSHPKTPGYIVDLTEPSLRIWCKIALKGRLYAIIAYLLVKPHASGGEFVMMRHFLSTRKRAKIIS